MCLVPVLDLKGGKVVRAVGGRREEYRPVVSLLTPETSPRAVARALVEAFLPERLYVADLDAIAGAAPAFDTLTELQSLGVALWADIGVRTLRAATALADAGIAGVVLGSETLPRPDVLQRAVRELGAERVIFSLDLRAGRPICAPDWGIADADGLARAAIDAGARQFIILDLASVGAGKGTGTESLCRRLISAHGDIEIFAGGGISGMDDVGRLQACGVKGVLVASALHDGRITPEAWS